MCSLVVVSVVLGLACASPILPRNPAVVAAENAAFLQHKAAADAAFVKEYNRLALLAFEAPDIHIITDDDIHHPQVQPVHYQAEEAVQNQVERMAVHQAGHIAGHQAQVVRTPTLTAQGIIIPKWEGPLADTIPAGVNGLPRQVTETPEVKAARQALIEAHAAAPQDDYEYNPIPADNEEPAQASQVFNSVNSMPHDFTFQAIHEPAVVSHNQVEVLAGHMAGHLAGQHSSVSSEKFLTAHAPIIKKWEGPFADTVPAGVNGAPQPVTETPAVKKARHALYAAHAAVPKPDPLYN